MWIYFAILTVFSFIIMGIDKEKAKKQKRRISEGRLLTLGVLGGSLGLLLGMYTFRHKTRKPAFKLGVPFIFVVQSAAGLFIYLSM